MRFPEFEGEWEEHNIGDFLSESKIIGHNGKEAKKLTVKLWAKGVVEKTTIFDGSMQTQYYIRKSGQLVYGKLDFLNCAFGIIPPELDGYETTSDAPAFDILNISSQFLLNRIIQTSFYKKNGEKANGSRKAKSIHPDTFLSMNVYVPSLLEQEKIATFILLLNKKLEIQENILKMLKLYKRGLSSKLFPQKGESVPQYRFEGFTDAWEQRKLWEIVDVYSGRDYKHLGEGTIPVYGTGGYMLSVSEALSENDDAIGIGRKGTIDNPHILRAPFWTVDTLFYCIPKKDLDLDFVFNIFQKINWKAMDESTGVPSLSKTAINNVAVMVPAKNEQAKLGGYFANLDHLITLYQQMCSEMQSIKKCILQNMFV